MAYVLSAVNQAWSSYLRAPVLQTLCHRNNQELQEIKDAYLQLFGKTLDHDLRVGGCGPGWLATVQCSAVDARCCFMLMMWHVLGTFSW
jgi:hypothetical protein